MLDNNLTILYPQVFEDLLASCFSARFSLCAVENDKDCPFYSDYGWVQATINNHPFLISLIRADEECLCYLYLDALSDFLKENGGLAPADEKGRFFMVTESFSEAFAELHELFELQLIA